MTRYDYHQVMTRRVQIAELKARLSEHLRAVRRGEKVTVLDRETPIAVIAPVEQPHPGLVVRQPTKELREFRRPRALKLKVAIDVLLAEERKDRF